MKHAVISMTPPSEILITESLQAQPSKIYPMIGLAPFAESARTCSSSKNNLRQAVFFATI